ncbi:MAG: hypothetical protein Kow00129_15620 [Thermoleophilia bacterium]
MQTARLVSLTFQPMLTGLYLLVAVGTATAPTVGQGLLWAVGLGFLTSIMPAADLALRVRKGRISDFQMILREERLRPLLAALTWSLVGLAAAILLGAPKPLIVTLAVGTANGIVLTAITTVWKISFHTATLTGALLVAAVLLQPVLLTLSPLIALVGWSRVKLGRHTPGQTVAGALVAALTSGAILSVLV